MLPMRVNLQQKCPHPLKPVWRINITPTFLSFDEDGMLLYEGKYMNFDIYGDVDTLVTMILEIAQRYKRNISGSFNYTDDQTGGCYSGIVFIFDNDNSAIINEYDTDETYTSDTHDQALDQRIIKLERKSDVQKKSKK